MNQVTIPLAEYAKKVENLSPDTWILIYTKNNPIQIKETEEKKGVLIKDVEVAWGGGTNQWNVGVVILILENIIDQMKG